MYRMFVALEVPGVGVEYPAWLTTSELVLYATSLGLNPGGTCFVTCCSGITTACAVLTGTVMPWRENHEYLLTTEEICGIITTSMQRSMM